MKYTFLFFVFINLICTAQWIDISPELAGYKINDIDALWEESNDSHSLVMACDNGVVIKAKENNFNYNFKKYSTGTLNDLNSCTLCNSRIFFAGDGVLLVSEDSLNSFEHIDIPETHLIRQLEFSESDKGYLIGDNGLFGISTNGGFDWVYDTLASTHLNKIYIDENSRLYIVGNEGLILRSQNEGENWKNLISPTNNDIIDVIVNSTGFGFVVSDCAYKTTDYGDSWIEDTQIPAPDSFYVALTYNNTGYTFYESNLHFVEITESSVEEGTLPGYGKLNSARYIEDLHQSTFYFGSPNLIGKRKYDNTFFQIAMFNNRPYEDFHFIDDQTGFVLGKYLHYTGDRGEEWENIDLPQSAEFKTGDIFFINEDKGYLLFNNVMYQTTNRGIAWINQGIFNNSSIVHFIDDFTGFIICDTITFKTTNSGLLWEEKKLSDNPATNFLPEKILFTTKLTGYIFGSGGYYYKTTNAGESWEKIWTGVFSFEDASAADSNNIVAVGYDYNNPNPYELSGVIYTTNNAGSLWTLTKNVTGEIFYSVIQDNNGKNYVSGRKNRLYYSDDFGITWTEENSPFSGIVDEFQSDYSGGVFALQTTNLKVLHNPDMNFIINEIIAENNDLKMGFNLEQNYPNPFNSSTVFNFIIPAAGRVKITIYNLIGEKVYGSFTPDLKAGKYSYKFDGSHLASGVYIFNMDYKDNSLSKKMVLLK
ncbi:MAG: hypothetical protein SCALA702_21500 [Melioribacteraceae bacterium]|nr:MAG: hypothetical protein SCALA702_21500 [Melioribacteraceae bacterium]